MFYVEFCLILSIMILPNIYPLPDEVGAGGYGIASYDSLSVCPRFFSGADTGDP